MKIRYDWLTSRDGFETFKLIYRAENGITLRLLQELRKLKNRGTIIEQVLCYEEKGLINHRILKKNKVVSINKPALLKVTDCKNIKTIDAVIYGLPTMEGLINYCKESKYKKPGQMAGLSKVYTKRGTIVSEGIEETLKEIFKKMAE